MSPLLEGDQIRRLCIVEDSEMALSEEGTCPTFSMVEETISFNFQKRQLMIGYFFIYIYIQMTWSQVINQIKF